MPYRPEPYRAPDAPDTKFAYNNRRWRRVRRKQLDRQPLCERCYWQGKVVPAEHVHHVVPIENGGVPYALENLESLCRACHSKQHAPVR